MAVVLELGQQPLHLIVAALKGTTHREKLIEGSLLVDVAGGDIQRADYRIERVIDSLDHAFEVALMAGGVGAGRS